MQGTPAKGQHAGPTYFRLAIARLVFSLAAGRRQGQRGHLARVELHPGLHLGCGSGRLRTNCPREAAQAQERGILWLAEMVGMQALQPMEVDEAGAGLDATAEPAVIN